MKQKLCNCNWKWKIAGFFSWASILSTFTLSDPRGGWPGNQDPLDLQILRSSKNLWAQQQMWELERILVTNFMTLSLFFFQNCFAPLWYSILVASISRLISVSQCDWLLGNAVIGFIQVFGFTQKGLQVHEPWLLRDGYFSPISMFECGISVRANHRPERWYNAWLSTLLNILVSCIGLSNH